MNHSEESGAQYVTVYRGLQQTAVEMLEAMLDAEGLRPRRQGRTNAALVGVGMYAMEQLIEVPAEHAERARELIAAFEQAPGDAQASALEEEALRAAPVTSASAPLDARPILRALALVAAVVALWWLARWLG